VIKAANGESNKGLEDKDVNALILYASDAINDHVTPSWQEHSPIFCKGISAFSATAVKSSPAVAKAPTPAASTPDSIGMPHATHATTVCSRIFAAHY
jgi:hypothetical protein